MTGNLEIEVLKREVAKSRDRLLSVKDRLALQIEKLESQVDEKNIKRLKNAEAMIFAIRDYAYTTESLIEALVTETEEQIGKTAREQKRAKFWQELFEEEAEGHREMIQIWIDKIGSQKNQD